MSLLTPAYNQSAKNKGGKNKDGKGKSKENKVYSVGRQEYLPTRCQAMYPDKTSGASTKSPVDGFSLYEDMRGAEMIGLHASMTRRGDSKCIEELQKVAIGVSENSACLLALLDTLRQQTSSPVPVLNLPLFTRLSKKLSDSEHALQVLDLARDVPRSDTDVQNAFLGSMPR